MASLLPRPVTFSTRGGLGFTTPPSKPPRTKKFGSYCFRATCIVNDVQGCPVAKVKGYDKTPQVSENTEHACRVHVGMMGAVHTCGPAEVVLLPSLDMECSGEVYFVMSGSVRRLV